MRKPAYMVMFVLLLVAQALIWNYINFSQFLMIAFLPVMILCIPIDKGVIFSMAVAFVTGFLADFFVGGMIGLTSLCLVPVALARKGIISLVFGSEVFSRGENISIRRQGIGKMSLGIAFCTAIFLILYIWVDGAGTRPFWFDVLKLFLSLLVSVPVSLFVTELLVTEDSRIWK